MCKVSNEYGFYVDGTQVGYLDDATEVTFAANLGIGALDVPGNVYDPVAGHIDEFRIQHSNYFGAAPNSTPNDTIVVPTEAYSAATPSSVKELMGVAQASVKKISGVAIASAKEIMGVANT